jgi:hypothetical protein
VWKEGEGWGQHLRAALVHVGGGGGGGADDGAQPTQSSAAFARHLTNSALAKNSGKATTATSGPLGLFEAQYLGGVPVESNKGQESCEMASESLLVRVQPLRHASHHSQRSDLTPRCTPGPVFPLPFLPNQLTKPTPTVVAISVSAVGIKVVEALTSEVLINTFIKNIACVCSPAFQLGLDAKEGGGKGSLLLPRYRLLVTRFTTVVDDKRILKLAKRKGSNPVDDALFVFMVKV